MSLGYPKCSLASPQESWPYLPVARSCSPKRHSKGSKLTGLSWDWFPMPRVRSSHIHEPSQKLASQTYLACRSKGCHAAAHGRTGQADDASARLKAAQLPRPLYWRDRWEAPHNPILAHNCISVQPDIRQTDVSALTCTHWTLGDIGGLFLLQAASLIRMLPLLSLRHVPAF